MPDSNKQKEKSCATCSLSADCSTQPGENEQHEPEPLFRGFRSALIAGCIFLCPVILAIAGSSLCARNHNLQFLGGLAGFGVGMVGASLVLKLVLPGHKGKINSQ